MRIASAVDNLSYENGLFTHISSYFSVTFAILGEKTTIMSPEVLLGAGVPCCRYFYIILVYFSGAKQNEIHCGYLTCLFINLDWCKMLGSLW